MVSYWNKCILHTHHVLATGILFFILSSPFLSNYTAERHAVASIIIAVACREETVSRKTQLVY